MDSSGQDFDLTVDRGTETLSGQSRSKANCGQALTEAKTWKLEDAKGQAVVQRFYDFVHNPLRSEAAPPALQVVKQETHDGDTWMHYAPKDLINKKPSLSRRNIGLLSVKIPSAMESDATGPCDRTRP